MAAFREIFTCNQKKVQRRLNSQPGPVSYSRLRVLIREEQDPETQDGDFWVASLKFLEPLNPPELSGPLEVGNCTWLEDRGHLLKILQMPQERQVPYKTMLALPQGLYPPVFLFTKLITRATFQHDLTGVQSLLGKERAYTPKSLHNLTNMCCQEPVEDALK